MRLPVTTPCAHNFCKDCVQEAFAGKTFVRKRLCFSGQALRSHKNVMKCPSCPADISEFLQNPQAAKILANLVVIGSGILARALVQAYRQALANASKSGVAQETVQNIRRGSKIMAELEARQILGVTEHSSWEEILQKYDNLFEQNAKNGSFYLQSKVHRAKECLESVY
ncbi:mitochondrial import inner membrane translocase subunit PAM16 like 1 [Vitis vinifera]|uniref:mitochondrial import inner membrane translocase subunit PAM16 like 1 n=1 Tax=Vitis vinifera TaxID=29760 RepID=UPI0008FECD06|nr:mitochondrial import inner membrane translocase subunit PAM16 like 1 [Vitis vinifera]|eukprot:XP_019082042.1 PREDICTED: uncharacterized protein LOC100267977 [Vitis vinifera]